jgi:hypothetical protein
MNYDLEAQEGKLYPHSRAFYLFDFRVHFKWAMRYPTDSSTADTIPQTKTILSKCSRYIPLVDRESMPRPAISIAQGRTMERTLVVPPDGFWCHG